MSCCGNNRARLYGAVPPQMATGNTSVPPAPPRAAAAAVVFEYMGETAVSAIGAVTRTLYRFVGKRAQVRVDARDAPSVGRVPNLRKVGGA